RSIPVRLRIQDQKSPHSVRARSERTERGIPLQPGATLLSMTPLESGPPSPPPEAPPARGRVRRRLWFWIPAAMVTLLVLGVFAAVLSLTLLFKSGDPELASHIVAFLNQAVGTDSTRFVTDGVRGTLTKGAIVKNPRLLVRTPSGEYTWARARSLRVDYD